MTPASKNALPFVLFEAGKGLYAVSAGFVREILLLPVVVRVPNAPPGIRGVVNVRGRVLKLVDLRVVLGAASARSEVDGLIQLLQEREQDHRNWLTELDACVRERRPFKLARDPHKCKFGLWYDQYRNQEQSIQAVFFRMALRKMEGPHRIIHACADDVLNLAQSGDFEQALGLLQKRQNCELAAMVKLFEESRGILKDSCREFVIVLANGAKEFAMCADSVQSVEHIPIENIETDGIGGTNWQVAQRAKTRQTVLLLKAGFLFANGAAN